MAKRVIYITYEDARRLKPLFDNLKKTHKWKEVRMAAGRLSRELDDVRDIDYEPLGGYQMMLDERDYEFLKDALGTI